MAFAIGSAIGGFAGGLYAPLVQFIEPNSFNLAFSLNLLLMVIVGGAGYLAGPFLGALVAILLPEWLRFTEGYYLILYATMVMLLMAVSPRGLLGLGERLLRPAAAATPASAARSPAP
jgi:branched-chain amino acid transport system permease protein